jgi:hypothetical protein
LAAKIKAANYTSYNIAYSAGGSADKMKTLATSAGGKLFSALDANAINNVFSEIADQIKGNYIVGNVDLKYTLPEGMQYTGPMADVNFDGTKYTQKVPDIIYKLSTDMKKYTADPFYISFKIKATKSGTYTLPENATFNYKGIDGSLISIKLDPFVNYVANDLVSEGTPVINANIEGQSPETGTVGQDLTLKCRINPETFRVFETTNGIKASSYTFKAKLKFNLQGKFESGLGLVNAPTGSNYEVETPEFDVNYKLNTDGSYMPELDGLKEFTVKVKAGVDINNLQFGPGIVSYIDLSNKSASTNIAPYTVNMKPAIQLESFGLYKGIDKNIPNILESFDPFNIEKNTNVRLGATLTGSINNTSDLKLDIESGILLKDTIDVYTYDDNGQLTKIGNMEKLLSTDTTKATYMYKGQEVVNKKILILYNETLVDTVSYDKSYINSFYIGNDIKTTKIKANNGLVELF